MDRLNRRIIVGLAIIVIAVAAFVYIIAALPPMEGMGTQIPRPRQN